MMTVKMVRSRTLAARSRLFGRSVGFSCVVTVHGASVAASCILESMTKVFIFCHFVVKCFCTFIISWSCRADAAWGDVPSLRS